MTAYKCDLCLYYCDDCYSINLPSASTKSGYREIQDICEVCCDKLEKWVNEIVRDRSEEASE